MPLICCNWQVVPAATRDSKPRLCVCSVETFKTIRTGIGFDLLRVDCALRRPDASLHASLVLPQTIPCWGYFS